MLLAFRDRGKRLVGEEDRNLKQTTPTPVSHAKNRSHTQLQHTVHSSTGLVSPKRALRWLGRSWLGPGGRLLKGMLGRLLILGRGRGKTGTTTSLVGHDAAKQITRTVAQGGRWCLRRARVRWRASNMRGHCLNTARFQLMSQNSNFGLVAVVGGGRWLATSLARGRRRGDILCLHLELGLF